MEVKIKKKRHMKLNNPKIIKNMGILIDAKIKAKVKKVLNM
jgi:hypothetical protein